MDINYELLKIFNEVAKAGSISKASEILHISQPAVTQSVHTLENNLKVQLFNRTPKGVTLTLEGQELYNYIKEGIKYFENGINKINSLKELEEGSINIGASSVISEHFLMDYVKEFSSKHPSIKINIINDLTDNLVKDLKNGTIDILISSDIDDKDIIFNKLTTLEDIFVGTKKYTTFDINKDKLLIQKTPSETRKNFDKYMKDNNIIPNIYMEVVSHNLLVKYTKEEFGVALLTKEFIKKELNNTLYEIKTNIKIPKRNLGYSVKKDTIPSYATKELIKIIKETI